MRWYEEKTGTKKDFIYGGSVTENNAASFRDVPYMQGLLVGGASLHARSFGAICRQFQPRV
jgi:triosephosphate isomerase